MVRVNKKVGIWSWKQVNQPTIARTLSLSKDSKKFWAALLLALLCRQTLHSAEDLPGKSDRLHIGPLYDRFSTTFGTAERTELLGPLFAWENSGTSSLFSF